MNAPSWIEKYTERSTRSIFSRFLIPEDMAAFWMDSSIGHDLKFTAALAAFADLKFPLRLSDFRQAVPDEFWRQHCRIFWVGSSTGFVPIYFGGGEWFYTLRFEQSRSMRNNYAVYFVATDDILPDAETEPDYGELDPPQDLPINRFTLCHPFLRPELHEPDGVRIFLPA